MIQRDLKRIKNKIFLTKFIYFFKIARLNLSSKEDWNWEGRRMYVNMERKYLLSKRTSGNYRQFSAGFISGSEGRPPKVPYKQFIPTILCNQDRSACREFWAPFWCVASERKCGNWCSSVFFSCRPDTTKPCVTSESNYSYISSNKKTTLAQLFVAMSCDEKNNKRRKKRSKQSSETNSHVAPNSVENREVRSDKLVKKRQLWQKISCRQDQLSIQLMCVRS